MYSGSIYKNRLAKTSPELGTSSDNIKHISNDKEILKYL